MYNHLCTNEKRSKCPLACNNIGHCQSQNKKEICPKTKKVLKLLGESVLGLIGARMTKVAIKKDRKARSRKHFRTEVYHTLSKNDRLTYDMNQKRKKLLKQPPLQ